MSRLSGFQPEEERIPFVYTQGGSAAILYPRLPIGLGFDAPAIDSAAQNGLLLGPGNWMLSEIVLVLVNVLGSTTFTLVTGAAFSSYSTLATAVQTLAAGPNRINFAKLAGAHVIPENRLVAIGIDPTSNHGQVNGVAIFTRVP
jgi:hypothetical protein